MYVVALCRLKKFTSWRNSPSTNCLIEDFQTEFQQVEFDDHLNNRVEQTITHSTQRKKRSHGGAPWECTVFQYDFIVCLLSQPFCPVHLGASGAEGPLTAAEPSNQ
jgi:hypothetical protein